MTDQHLTFRQFEAYAARRLAPGEIAAFHQHVEHCPQCRDMLEATVAASGTEHLTEQQAVDYVSGRLTGPARSAAGTHIHRCDACNAMVGDLVEFQPTLAPRRPLTTWLLPLAAALVLAAGIFAWFALRSPSRPNAVVAELRDTAGTWQLTKSNVLRSAAPLPPGSDDLIAAVLRTGQLPPGPADLPALAKETLRSDGGAASAAASLRIVSPDRSRVLSDRPEFRWNMNADAQETPVQIQVFDADFNEVAHSGPVRDSVWVPESPLPRTKLLQWQITQVRNGVRITAPASPAPPARFEIVSENLAQRIAAARLLRPPSHLLLAILYSQAGLTQEAAAETAEIARLNPGSSLASSLEKR
jgi:hypothetical protein